MLPPRVTPTAKTAGSKCSEEQKTGGSTGGGCGRASGGPFMMDELQTASELQQAEHDSVVPEIRTGRCWCRVMVDHLTHQPLQDPLGLVVAAVV